MNQYEEISANRGKLMLGICNRTINTEISKDHTLPDYLPEIRRVLGVREHILPPAKYVSGDSVELSGSVDYTLIYVGADGELYSAPVSDEYDITAPLDQNPWLERNRPLSVAADIVAENINARVTAPRKVSIRCRMNCHVRVYGCVSLEEEINGEASEENIQRLVGEETYASVWVGSSELLEVSDELETDADSRVISADAYVAVGDMSSERDGVLVRGDVILKLLCGKKGGDNRIIQRRLPFSEKVETDRDINECEMRRAKGSISSINVNQEDGRITSTVGFFIEAEEESNIPFSYTADLYSTERECDCEYENVRVLSAEKNIFGNLSQSERISLSESGVPEGAEIVDVCGKAHIDSVAVSDGKCVLSGEARYSLICSRDGEFSASEIKLPFRYETDMNRETELSADNLAIDCSVSDCRVRADGDILAVDGEILMSGIAFGERTVCRVKSASMGEAIDRRGSDIIICYPSAGESVWNVAKKYLVSPQNVMGDPQRDRYCIIQM